MFSFINSHELIGFEAARRNNQHFFAKLYMRYWGSLFKTIKSSHQTPEDSLLNWATVFKTHADLI